MFDPQQDLLWTVCEQAKQVEHLHQQDDYKFLRRPALDKVALRLKHRVGICLIGNTQRDITVVMTGALNLPFFLTALSHLFVEPSVVSTAQHNNRLLSCVVQSKLVFHSSALLPVLASSSSSSASQELGD